MSQIPSKLIADLAITEGKINTGAVTGGKIADNVVDSQHYVDASIDAEHLSAGAKAVPLQEKLGLFLNRINSIALGTGTSVNIMKKVIDASYTKRFLTHSVSNKLGIPQRVSGYDDIAIRDSATGDPIADSNNRQVYGRMYKNDSGTLKTGTITTDVASTSVVGVGTLFSSEFVVGDPIYVSNDDNEFYFIGYIDTITDDLNVVLTANAYWDFSAATIKIPTVLCKFYVNIAGVQTEYTAESQTADMEFGELYNLYTVPANAFSSGVAFAEGLPAGHIHDDRYYTETELDNGQLDSRYYTETELGSVTHSADGSGLVGFEETGWSATTVHGAILEAKTPQPLPEAVTIATQDTFPELARTPADSTKVMLYVFGRLCEYGATKDYTCTGKQITWYEATAGYHVDPGDPVTAVYA